MKESSSVTVISTITNIDLVNFEASFLSHSFLTLIQICTVREFRMSNSIIQEAFSFPKNLTVIESVYAQNCTLTHLPTNMDFLSGISLLYLSNNFLSGDVLFELSALTNLGVLDISNNLVTSLTSQNQHLGISRSLPSNLSLWWPNIVALNLKNISLSGLFPTSAPATLTYLDLSFNNLTGWIYGGIVMESNIQVDVTNNSYLFCSGRLRFEYTCSLIHIQQGGSRKAAQGYEFEVLSPALTRNYSVVCQFRVGNETVEAQYVGEGAVLCVTNNTDVFLGYLQLLSHDKTMIASNRIQLSLPVAVSNNSVNTTHLSVNRTHSSPTTQVVNETHASRLVNQTFDFEMPSLFPVTVIELQISDYSTEILVHLRDYFLSRNIVVSVTGIAYFDNLTILTVEYVWGDDSLSLTELLSNLQREIPKVISVTQTKDKFQQPVSTFSWISYYFLVLGTFSLFIMASRYFSQSGFKPGSSKMEYAMCACLLLLSFMFLVVSFHILFSSWLPTDLIPIFYLLCSISAHAIIIR
jgi:Leucine-rich repeat (LRR) protein